MCIIFILCCFEFHFLVFNKSNSFYFIFQYPIIAGPSWSWSHGSWIYNCLCNLCISPLKLFGPRSWRDVLDTTLCDKVCQWLATGRWFSPGTAVSSTNKTDRHDSTEIVLKVALSTTNLIFCRYFKTVDTSRSMRKCQVCLHLEAGVSGPEGIPIIFDDLYIMTRTSYISMRLWLWCPLCSRPTRLDGSASQLHWWWNG